VGRTAARATGAHAHADSNLDLKEGIFQRKWDKGGLQSWGIRHQSKGVGVLKGAAREESRPRGCGQRGLDDSAARYSAPRMYASDETLRI
jgi:hypothetical protein